jgi:hypothetical protein
MRAAAFVALAISACYSPNLDPCTVRCAPGDHCPDEMSCGADQYCHPAGDTSACSPDYFTVEVHSAGTGTGTVAGSDLDCGALCEIAMPTGATVKLTATPDSGSRFNAWSGACAGATGVCSLRVDHDLVIGATFNMAKPLSVTFAGAGDGQVVSNPVGIDCTEDCTALFDLNSAVTLTATPTDPSTFIGWSGACEGTGPCVVSMSDSMQVTAEFE